MSDPDRDRDADQALAEQGLYGYRVVHNDLSRIMIPFGTKGGSTFTGPVTITRAIVAIKPADNLILNLSMMSAGEMERPGG